MNSVCFPSAIVKPFEFRNRAIVFSSMILSTPVTEQEKRKLIFAGIEQINFLPEEEKDCGESSEFLFAHAEMIFANMAWKEALYPVFIFLHQELCLQSMCMYINHIHRKISGVYGIKCGLIEVPRVLFQGLERIICTQSRIPPLAVMRN